MLCVNQTGVRTVEEEEEEEEEAGLLVLEFLWAFLFATSCCQKLLLGPCCHPLLGSQVLLAPGPLCQHKRREFAQLS